MCYSFVLLRARKNTKCAMIDFNRNGTVAQPPDLCLIELAHSIDQVNKLICHVPNKAIGRTFSLSGVNLDDWFSFVAHNSAESGGSSTEIRGE